MLYNREAMVMIPTIEYYILYLLTVILVISFVQISLNSELIITLYYT